jgi:hypothetical protein
MATKPTTAAAAPPVILAFPGATLPAYHADFKATLRSLAEPFNPEDIYFLPQTIKSGVATAAAYADSRVYTERMDAVIGPGFWQSEVVRVDIAPYTKLAKARLDWQNKDEQGNARVLEPAKEVNAYQVGLVVRVGIWMGPVLGWVWHDSTGAKDTADGNWITTAEAQAYKRAMSKWGPGRYLYAFPTQECKYNSIKKCWTDQPQIPDWAYPAKDCSECASPIVTVEYEDAQHNKRSLHFWDVFLRSQAQYGVPLCAACSKKRRNAQVTPEAEQRLVEQKAA